MKKMVSLLCCLWLLPPTAHAAPPGPPSPTTPKSGTHTRKAPQSARTAHANMRPSTQHEGKRELRRWFTPISPRPKAPAFGARSAAIGLRTYVASRWGTRFTPKARKRLRNLFRPLLTWNPGALYRKLRYKSVHPQLHTRIKYFRSVITAPKPNQPLPQGLGQGGMTLHVKPLKRRNARSERPYRLTFRAHIGIASMASSGFDKLIQTFIERVTDPQLNLSPSPQTPKLFSSIRKGHSRKIANWVQTILPRTAKLADRFWEVSEILEPTPQGTYRLNFRLRWRTENLVKDYPFLRKSIRNKKRHIYAKTEFLDMQKRPWLHWTYDRKIWTIKLRGAMKRQGFMICGPGWKPLSGPWRPSQNLNTQWLTRSQLRFHSSWIRASMTNMLIKWTVRKTPKGASLTIRFLNKPKLSFQGGEFLRVLARLFIPGGIERLFDKVLYDLAYGDNGKGLRWRWEIVERNTHANVRFQLQIPIIPNQTLSSIMRLASSFRRRTRRARRKPRKARKARRVKRPPNVRKAKVRYTPRRRRRRHKPWIWVRLYRALHKDLLAAAHHKPPKPKP